MKLPTRQIEAENRGEVTALLIHNGYSVYRPEADVGGEDLVVRCPRRGLLCVQLKGRARVDRPRYGGRDIWMLFPETSLLVPGRGWFLVPHDHLFGWVEAHHRHALGWQEAWDYPKIPKWLKAHLGPFRIPHAFISSGGKAAEEC